jgi:threonine dehydrogenase-like Zn-dependent dehydrogenase
MSDLYSDAPDNLVRVPASLRSVAVLVEPMTVAQKSLERAFQMQAHVSWAPRRAVVLGAGPIGILAAVALRLRGLEVTVGSREPAESPRAAYLAEAGIRFRSTATSPLEEWSRDLGPIDLVFEATGAAGVVFPAISLLGPDGVCILSSVTGSGTPVEVDAARFNREIMMGNRVVFGTVSSAHRHFEAAVRDLLAAEERLPGWVARMITRRLAMSEVLQAFERRPDDIKTVLRFD